jgi:hypothetical protein
MVIPVGTYSWANLPRHGVLGAWDFVRLGGQLVARAPRFAGDAIAMFAPRRPREPAPLAPGPLPDDTRIVRDATEACEGASVGPDTWLFPHSQRSFHLARYIAAARGIPYDPEVLWVASMFHDIGLVADEPGSPCFAVRSADRAYEFAAAHGWSAGRSTQLANSISMHINIRVSRWISPEGHLLNAASALDVAGLGLRAFDCEFVRIELAREREPDFGESIADAWNRSAAQNPRCRAAVLRGIGFSYLMRHGPVS